MSSLCINLIALKELYSMNNFNTLMQLYTALNMPLIERLRLTWSLVPAADRDILKKARFGIC